MIDANGQKVQIKANHSASTIGFRGEADLLLVIKVAPDGAWTELYYGPFAAVMELARYSARDNKHMVAVRHLVALAAAVGEGPHLGMEAFETDAALEVSYGNLA